MKRVLIILSILASFQISAAAQDSGTGKKVRNEFAVTLGPRAYIGTAIYTDMIGGSAGVDYALNRIIGPIDLCFGLNYAYMVDLKNDSGSTITAMDIQLPVSLRYGLPVGNSRILFYAGPLAHYGISMKHKDAGGGISDMYQGNYNRFDIMCGGGVGVVAGKHFRITLDAYYGFLSRRKTISSAKNLQAGLGIAYLF